MKNRKLAVLSIFSALIIVLQLISTYINFGAFPITLTLIPIIIAGAIYSQVEGAIMGAVFGVIVSIMVIVGADPSGAMMFEQHPVITIATCIIKGCTAGFAGAIAYKKINNKTVAIVVDAIVTPITNTILLYTSITLFFNGSFFKLIAGLMTVNFAIEVGINILIAPGLLGLINRFKSRNH